MVNSYINVGKNNKPPEKKYFCLSYRQRWIPLLLKTFLKDTFIDENIFEIMVIDCLDKNNLLITYK